MFFYRNSNNTLVPPYDNEEDSELLLYQFYNNYYYNNTYSDFYKFLCVSKKAIEGTMANRRTKIEFLSNQTRTNQTNQKFIDFLLTTETNFFHLN